jgi:hypothetical protein
MRREIGYSSLVSLAAAMLLYCPTAIAQPVTGSYDVSFSLRLQILGLTDGLGNPLSTLPSDLSITGKTIDETGSGFFAFLFGPNRPASITTSSAAGSGDVIVGGSPSGDGPLSLGIGDGFILNSFAAGSIGRPLAPQPACDVAKAVICKRNIAHSDISQSGEFAFINSSFTATYFANILVAWTWDIITEDNITPGELSPGESFDVEAGYVFDLGTRFPNTGSTTFFGQNGFITTIAGEGVRQSTGSNSFVTTFAVAPGEQPILTALPFVGGVAAKEPAPIPEPSTLTLFGLGGILVIGVCSRRRREACDPATRQEP